MHKVVYNAYFGEFSLSYEALEIIAASRGKNLFYYEQEGEWQPNGHIHYVYVEDPEPNKDYTIFDEDVGDEYWADDENQKFRRDHYYSPYMYELARHDPVLVAAVETLGEKANGMCADLQIKEIEGNLYRIDDYDGSEIVVTPEKEEWVRIENT